MDEIQLTAFRCLMAALQDTCFVVLLDGAAVLRLQWLYSFRWLLSHTTSSILHFTQVLAPAVYHVTFQSIRPRLLLLL